MHESAPAPIASPCVRQCCLDPQDVCVGCGRSLDEILAWHQADEAGRRAILERARERLRERGRSGGAGTAAAE